MDDRVHVDARVAGPTEDLDDAAARRVVGVIPIFHIDDDQLAGLRGGVAGDVDCAVDCFVLAFDPAELAVLPVGADEAARPAGEDFFDASADFIGLRGEELAAGAREAFGAGFGEGNHHAIAIEGGTAIASWDMDARVRGEVDAGGEVRFVGGIGEKERVAFWVELERADERAAALCAQQVAGFFAFVNVAGLDEAFDRHA